jgi:small-conductance mechanosensitive channel
MTLQPFDKDKHILVVRDAATGKHTHVAFGSIVQQVAQAAPVSVDLSAITKRIEDLERTPGTGAPSDLLHAINDLSAKLAHILDRLNQLEQQHHDHGHDYKLADKDIAEIASRVLSSVLEQTRRAA